MIKRIQAGAGGKRLFTFSHDALVDAKRLVIEHARDHTIDLGLPFTNDFQSDSGSLLLGKTIHPGRDRGEGDRTDVIVLCGEIETPHVGPLQQIRFP